MNHIFVKKAIGDQITFAGHKVNGKVKASEKDYG